MRKKTIIMYAISIGDNDHYEVNVMDELLLFYDYDEIAEYAKVNSIDLDDLYVHEFEVEDDSTK